MIQIRKEENQKKQKEKKLKVYKVNTHKKTVIALWVLLAVSFLFAVYKNFTAIDIHTAVSYTHLKKNREYSRKSASGTPAHPPAAGSLRHSRPRCRTGG